MSLFGWLKGLRKREEDAALRRAADEQLESPRERRISEGDMEGMQADEQTGLRFGETADEPERLAE